MHGQMGDGGGGGSPPWTILDPAISQEKKKELRVLVFGKN